MSDECPSEVLYWKAVDLWDAGQPREARQCAQEALLAEPGNVEAQILLGELYLFEADDLTLSREDALNLAISCFKAAVESSPLHADAWAGKALASLYRGEFDTALRSVEEGFRALVSGVGYGLTYAPVRTRVEETLWKVKIKALVGIGDLNAAREVLHTALLKCPQSVLLQRLSREL